MDDPLPRLESLFARRLEYGNLWTAELLPPRREKFRNVVYRVVTRPAVGLAGSAPPGISTIAGRNRLLALIFILIAVVPRLPVFSSVWHSCPRLCRTRTARASNLFQQLRRHLFQEARRDARLRHVRAEPP